MASWFQPFLCYLCYLPLDSKVSRHDAMCNSHMGDPITVWDHGSVMSPLQHPPGVVGRTAKATKVGTPSNLAPSFIQESEMYLPYEKNPGVFCFLKGWVSANIMEDAYTYVRAQTLFQSCDILCSSATLQSMEDVLTLWSSENQNPGNRTVYSCPVTISCVSEKTVKDYSNSHMGSM